MRIRIDNARGGLIALHVHPHVKRSVEAEREASLRRIELVGAHAQVGENSVEPSFRVEEGIVMDEAEIIVYKNESGVVGRLGEGVGVAVEGHQVPLRGEARENLAVVAAAAEGRIRIEAVRVEHQGVYAFFEKDGIVIF